MVLKTAAAKNDNWLPRHICTSSLTVRHSTHNIPTGSGAQALLYWTCSCTSEQATAESTVDAKFDSTDRLFIALPLSLLSFYCFSLYLRLTHLFIPLCNEARLQTTSVLAFCDREMHACKVLCVSLTHLNLFTKQPYGEMLQSSRMTRTSWKGETVSDKKAKTMDPFTCKTIHFN